VGERHYCAGAAGRHGTGCFSTAEQIGDEEFVADLAKRAVRHLLADPVG
jgi:hypothetical protein